MALLKQEVRTYFGQCKCCLNYAYLKNMWKREKIDGVEVFYGQMLVDCFSIAWIMNSDPDDDKICDMCILRLRDAASFKKQVLQSQQELQESIVEEYAEIKEDDNGKHSDVEQKSYEDVQFLEDEMLEDVSGEDNDSIDTKPKPKKRKWPQRLPKGERNKTYRQYTDDQLAEAFKAVKSKDMTILQAAVKHGVPRQTLKAKTLDDNYDIERQNNMNQFIKEVAAILAYTNATPFRAKSYKYYCIFCTAEINNPTELRTHTHTKHTDKDKKVEFVMRPHYYYEMFKLDVLDLKCSCSEEGTWQDMLSHLEAKHEMVLEESRNRIIPYTLGDNEMPCAICDYTSSFISIDKHMNKHFPNHICGECGEVFATAARVNSHWKSHKIGVFPCDQCDKIFSREPYRKKHMNVVHRKKLIYKCLHCDERFHSDVVKHRHMEKEHGDKLQTKTCEECHKTFTFGASFTQHVRSHRRKLARRKRKL